MSFGESDSGGAKFLKGSVIVSVMTVGSLSFFLSLTEFFDTKKQSSDLVKIFSTPRKLDSVSEQRIKEINSEMSALNTLLKSMKDSEVPVNVDFAKLESQVGELNSRLTTLENAISSNPEKALIVPMLRKDHEALAKQFNDSLVSSKLDYDRLWSMLMLLLTSLGAAVVVLSGWALKSLLVNPNKRTALQKRSAG
ncbi:hypothetical protein N5C62_22105 [Pseudomonas atacamensis]|uniref:hypothetical protein n=1 Tax=Pseudomonas atacamensis TaxID=2565368 RepID=UPI002448A8D6|nr:hypothetical protein [Pseudomonas atacamensis]MDH1260365.1 hypothetical protein [Pseudomonas atacamensis]